jgi:hypothetical protein
MLVTDMHYPIADAFAFAAHAHELIFVTLTAFIQMQLAAQRITNYWNRRIELFGNDRAFKPLHLGEDGAITPIHDNDNSDDEQFVKHTIRGLSLGFIRPTKTHIC